MNALNLVHWAASAPRWEPALAAVAVLAGSAVAWHVAAAAVRRMRRYDLADVITVLIALAATVYAGAGSWKFLGDAMHYGTDLRVILVAVFEGAVIAEGLRSRRNIAETGAAGADGIGLWVLTAMSGVLATSVSANVREALGRLIVPAVGAWLWERLLAPERRAHKARRASGPVRWRITPERIFVWLRLADAVDTDVSTVEAGRRVAKYLKATDRLARPTLLRMLTLAGPRAYRGRMRLISDALRHGDPTQVHERLSEAAFADAMTRLGLTSVSQDGAFAGESGAGSGESLLTPEHPDFEQFVASLPRVTQPSPVSHGRTAAATGAARRQASVTARVGVDRESAERAYRKSVRVGKPLSSRELAARADVSQSTAARVISEVRAEAGNGA